MFQSTHPHGVRRGTDKKILCGYVSIHAPTRGATRKMIGRWAPENEFQSTHPHGVRLHNPKLSLSIVRFQSTHPHGVRHQGVGVTTISAVSIHAPTRGATNKTINAFYLSKVSIHAPTRGATTGSVLYSASHLRFQSTHPHGVRLSLTYENLSLSKRFNPRTHTGCDIDKFRIWDNRCMFQSTHPHGVRLNNRYISDYLLPVSIHAPTRGATKQKRMEG